ncbi:phage capsid protein [Achromobacter xylosoxidans]|uniref:phage capsid protein n=1 Tax=Achromobacter ruhlandii TaxID=72557 RepID=UPI003B9AF2F7
MNPIPLNAADADYASMTKIGTLEICQMASGELLITAAGFEFQDPPTCRMHAVRAMAWARDLLDAQVKVERLANTKVCSAVG